MQLPHSRSILLSGCDCCDGWLGRKPDILPPAGEHYASKPDFARVEYEYPIPLEELAKDHAEISRQA
jgi:hypothetical protein